jgi:hypothetical protein
MVPLPVLGGGSPPALGRCVSFISRLVTSSGLGFSSSIPSSPSTADQRQSFNFSGPVPTYIPSYDYGGPPPPGGYPHGPVSAAATSASAAVPMRSLSHDDISPSSVSDVTMSFWTPAPPGGPSLPARPPPPAASPAAAVPAPTSASSSSSLTSHIHTPTLRPTKIFKLTKIKDAKSYLDLQELIDYHLCLPE